ncbi:histidine--tRNA ligase [Cnuibacter physcomitrellae]|uniref:histidine--tRNA ligase n=1 Tax=Cnuibacter physcomitrellae TaxID=1619308 RepID=UPI0021761BF4|nr:histidine--tRNA ligase [Cnuibacter physcomitrellae]MCS5496480.1 histidine--tRNA ligase [Cnuibacter physcomitrellae]
MASPVVPPRGMRDFLPHEKAKRERALGVIRRVYAAHGFDEIETPVVEDYDRLHSGLGGDNEKLAFNLLRRGLTRADLEAAAASDDPDSLADLGLRFDLTVPLARFYASHRAELPQVFRSVQVAPVWRAERPQKGRYRQFVQCDIDIIGEAGLLAEVELIAATLATLDALGLTGCSVRINDRRILNAMLAVFGFGEDEVAPVLITLDKLDKIGAAGVVAELRDRGVSASAADAVEAHFAAGIGGHVPLDAEAMLAVLPSGVDRVAVDDLAAIGAALAAAGVAGSLTFDPFLVRGMGYYTGTIFEIEHPEFSFSLGGGGRYDGMIGRFVGEQVPACGFSIGFERIIDLIADEAGEEHTAVVLVHGKDVAPERLLSLKTALVSDGAARVRLERRTKNLGNLLDRAAAAGFTHFAQVSETTSSVADLELRTLA